MKKREENAHITQKTYRKFPEYVFWKRFQKLYFTKLVQICCLFKFSDKFWIFPKISQELIFLEICQKHSPEFFVDLRIS